jgi:LTXXQ motif family protein
LAQLKLRTLFKMTLPIRAVRRLAPFAASAVLSVALCGPALSQPYGGGPGGSYGGDAQDQLRTLHAALHITAAQEDAWRAFMAASQPDPQQQARERAAEQMLPGLTAPQRVDLSLAAMQADLASMRQRGAALKAFYATLTPSQQATFDRETLPRDEGEGGY